MNQIIQLSKKNTLIYIVLVVVGGLFLGYQWGESQTEKAVLQEVFGDASFSNNLSGQVLEVVPSKEILIAKIPGIRGVNFPKEYQRKQVLVDSNTKIVLRTKKDDAVFEGKEISESGKGRRMVMPTAYIEEEIGIDDLFVGDDITFSFVQDEDDSILNTQFVATQINVNR